MVFDEGKIWSENKIAPVELSQVNSSRVKSRQVKSSRVKSSQVKSSQVESTFFFLLDFSIVTAAGVYFDVKVFDTSTEERDSLKSLTTAWEQVIQGWNGQKLQIDGDWGEIV